MPPYVLDTSVILFVLYHEDGADQVMEILETARGRPRQKGMGIFVPFIALMETEYRLLPRFSPREVEDALVLVESWPITVHESTPEWRHEAAWVKASVPLSVAGAWAASLAMLHHGQLVHKDPEFDQVDGLEMVRLPYKKGTA